MEKASKEFQGQVDELIRCALSPARFDSEKIRIPKILIEDDIHPPSIEAIKKLQNGYPLVRDYTEGIAR